MGKTVGTQEGSCSPRERGEPHLTCSSQTLGRKEKQRLEGCSVSPHGYTGTISAFSRGRRKTKERRQEGKRAYDQRWGCVLGTADGPGAQVFGGKRRSDLNTGHVYHHKIWPRKATVGLGRCHRVPLSLVVHQPHPHLHNLGLF